MKYPEKGGDTTGRPFRKGVPCRERARPDRQWPLPRVTSGGERRSLRRESRATSHAHQTNHIERALAPAFVRTDGHFRSRRQGVSNVHDRQTVRDRGSTRAGRKARSSPHGPKGRRRVVRGKRPAFAGRGWIQASKMSLSLDSSCSTVILRYFDGSGRSSGKRMFTDDGEKGGRAHSSRTGRLRAFARTCRLFQPVSVSGRP